MHSVQEFQPVRRKMQSHWLLSAGSGKALQHVWQRLGPVESSDTHGTFMMPYIRRFLSIAVVSMRVSAFSF